MKKKRPNIVLFMTDNQPADLLGCSGNEEVHTPNPDRMAQHGIHTWIDDRAMDAWPAEWNALDEFRTLPEILSENGYNTAMVGKYPLGDPFKAQNGFQHWVTFPHGHTRSFWNNTIIENGKQYTYRTPQWLYMRRFSGSGAYPMADEMYDLSTDPHEKTDLLENGEHRDVDKSLADQIDDYFRKNSTEKYNLWSGGITKSNTDKAYLWKDAWGNSWQPVYGL